MSLEVTRRGEEGITVPYGPIYDGVRVNRGFSDLRGRPDLAAKIVEGKASAALAKCLIRIAEENVYFSLGCDLGFHEEPFQPSFARHVAGGYLQITGIKYSEVSTTMIDCFCVAFEKKLRRMSGAYRWRVELVGKFVGFCLSGEPQVTTPSIWIWFFAAAKSASKAKESREALIAALEKAIHEPETYSTVQPK